MHERKRPGGFYAYPEDASLWRRLLWRLGFDPLTRKERLAQVRREAADWKRWDAEGRIAASEVGQRLTGFTRIEWADEVRAHIERSRAAGGSEWAAHYEKAMNP